MTTGANVPPSAPPPPGSRSIWSRMIRAAKLDVNLYEEVEHESDPLNSDSLPVDPNKVFGIVIGNTFSILNDADPTGVLYGETFSIPFAVLNDADPSGEPFGHVWGPLFSIENQAGQ